MAVVGLLALVWYYFSGAPGRDASTTGERLVTARGDLAADEKATIELFEKSRGSVVFISTSQLVQDAWTRNIFPRLRVPVPALSGTTQDTW
ncbi:hypothetical protein [Novosphingobium panipatense]